MPPSKRVRDDKLAAEKRFKNAIEESAAEFVCPITQELPLDPVMAADGRVYEREAIKEWLAKGNGKSPSTNESMGSKLLPAIQVKNMISSMVKSGALSGDIVESWQMRIGEEEHFQGLLAEAEAGDADKMCDVGNAYYFGRHGVKTDELKAHRWYKRAADAGCARGLYYLAICHVTDGIGCEPSNALAVHYYTRAAEMGQRGSACKLGQAFANGKLGLPKDLDLAAQWVRLSLEPATGKGNELSEPKRVWASAWLEDYGL